MRQTQVQRDGVTVVVTNTHQGVQMSEGWDISSINVSGIARPSGKKGEFATEQEAIEAALKLGLEYKNTLSDR